MVQIEPPCPIYLPTWTKRETNSQLWLPAAEDLHPSFFLMEKRVSFLFLFLLRWGFHFNNYIQELKIFPRIAVMCSCCAIYMIACVARKVFMCPWSICVYLLTTKELALPTKHSSFNYRVQYNSYNIPLPVHHRILFIHVSFYL